MVTDMQKLTEFLLKETPGHAYEIFAALNAMIEAIENTKAVVDGNILKLLPNGRHDESAPYIEASKELMQLSTILSKILEGTETNHVRSMSPRHMDYLKILPINVLCHSR